MTISSRHTGQGLLFPERFGYSRNRGLLVHQRAFSSGDQWEDEEMAKLLEELVRAAETRVQEDPEQRPKGHRAGGRRYEFDFPQVAEICARAGLFPWIIANGRWNRYAGRRRFELEQNGKSALGRRLAVLDSGKVFQLETGRQVRLRGRRKSPIAVQINDRTPDRFLIEAGDGKSQYDENLSQ